MRALVVDDSAVMRKVLIGALGRANITEVDQASDGQEAVEAVDKTQYDLILMDWNMPNMTGIEFVKSLRSSGNNTPIVMITTEGSDAKMEEAKSCGANGYLTKPFTPDQLKTKLGNFLLVK